MARRRLKRTIVVIIVRMGTPRPPRCTTTQGIVASKGVRNVERIAVHTAVIGEPIDGSRITAGFSTTGAVFGTATDAAVGIGIGRLAIAFTRSAIRVTTLVGTVTVVSGSTV